MSLENLLKIGQLEAHTTDAKQLGKLLNAAARSLADAEEVIGHARKGRCVAIPVELTDSSIAYPYRTMTVGVLVPPDGHP